MNVRYGQSCLARHRSAQFVRRGQEARDDLRLYADRRPRRMDARDIGCAAHPWSEWSTGGRRYVEPRRLRKLRALLTRPEAHVEQRILDALRSELDDATEDMRMFLYDLVRAAPIISSARALSERAGLNAAALNSRFFRASLPSPKTYLGAVRVLYAAAILEDARVSLAQVAIRLHYSSPQSFTRHLRERFHIPASEFRARYSFTALASHTVHHLLTSIEAPCSGLRRST